MNSQKQESNFTYPREIKPLNPKASSEKNYNTFTSILPFFKSTYPLGEINKPNSLICNNDERKRLSIQNPERRTIISIPKPVPLNPYKQKPKETLDSLSEKKNVKEDEEINEPLDVRKEYNTTKRKRKIVKEKANKQGKPVYEFKSKRLQKRRERKETSKEELLIKDDDNIKSRLFNSLTDVLKLIFLNENQYNKDLVLSNNEALILETIIQKKFKTKFVLSTIVNQKIRQKFIKNLKRKRSDEMNKFIFKNAFKYMRDAFNIKNDLNRKGIMKEEKRDRFFEYYFGELATKRNMSIEAFYLPQVPSNLKTAKKAKPTRTINTAYINDVFQSKLFYEDFKSFIRNNMRSFCIDNVKKKFTYLITKWEGMCESSVPNDRSYYSICDDIEYNKKCKLPWSILEIDEAIEESHRLVSKFS